MTPYFASHLAFYVILALGQAWPISGGYDSCRVILDTVERYGIKAQCMSGIEWDHTGRPGVRSEVVAP